MDISVDKVCEIIAHLRAVEAREGHTDPASGSNPTDDGAIDVLQDAPGPDAYAQQIAGVIGALDVDEAADLIALMWLGRGDYEGLEWDAARAAARERRENAPARYILGIPNAADLLDEGLSVRGLSCGGGDGVERLT